MSHEQRVMVPGHCNVANIAPGAANIQRKPTVSGLTIRHFSAEPRCLKRTLKAKVRLYCSAILLSWPHPAQPKYGWRELVPKGFEGLFAFGRGPNRKGGGGKRVTVHLWESTAVGRWPTAVGG